jgi:hypothetical protein
MLLRAASERNAFRFRRYCKLFLGHDTALLFELMDPYTSLPNAREARARLRGLKVLFAISF